MVGIFRYDVYFDILIWRFILTVIAYKDGILAADTLVTLPDRELKMLHATKIWKAPDGALVGASGDSDYCLQFKQWCFDGRLDSINIPAPKLTHELDMGLLITPEGKIRHYYGATYDELMDPFYAIGSGGPLAMAVMWAEGPATLAVEAACKYNLYCDLPIEYLLLGDVTNTKYSIGKENLGK